MQVQQIWRYPVKSMGGEQLASAEILDSGIRGDRAWGLYEPSTDTVLTARRAPDLLFASARVEEASDGDEVVVTLPDGTETNSDADLSRWLGREVSLIRPGDHTATFENPMDVENDADWVSWQGPDGSFHDSGRSRLSIVGVDSLAGRDVRRFRTNIVVTGSGEDELVGRQVTLGSATLAVTKAIDRCVMVTRPQPGLDRDLSVLKDLIANRNNLLSVGATVTVPGSVSLGQVLRLSL